MHKTVILLRKRYFFGILRILLFKGQLAVFFLQKQPYKNSQRKNQRIDLREGARRGIPQPQERE
jgi:hypothetical protein